MKTLGLFILTAFFSVKGFSQDTLYTTKGKIINGRVTEITQDEIKYKKASNPDGPTYVIEKSDIVLVHYKNGSKDVFESSSSANTNNNSTASNSNQNNTNQDPVYVNTRPNVNVVVGGGYPLVWGWGGWGWNRGYYGGGYYRNYGYYRGYRGGGYYHGGGYGHHYGGGHWGHH